jgi:hypothetical protein
MTAVEIARARLARTTAKRATPKKRIAKTSLRQDDSGTQSALEGAAESALARTMTTTADTLPPQLPDDIGALRALILTERAAHAATMAERTQLAERIAIVERANAKLEHIVAELKRAQFGRRSERITDDQLALALDELETAAAQANAEVEKADPDRKAAAARLSVSAAALTGVQLGLPAGAGHGRANQGGSAGVPLSAGSTKRRSEPGRQPRGCLHLAPLLARAEAFAAAAILSG